MISSSSESELIFFLKIIYLARLYEKINIYKIEKHFEIMAWNTGVNYSVHLSFLKILWKLNLLLEFLDSLVFEREQLFEARNFQLKHFYGLVTGWIRASFSISDYLQFPWNFSFPRFLDSRVGLKGYLIEKQVIIWRSPGGEAIMCQLSLPKRSEPVLIRTNLQKTCENISYDK